MPRRQPLGNWFRFEPPSFLQVFSFYYFRTTRRYTVLRTAIVSNPSSALLHVCPAMVWVCEQKRSESGDLASEEMGRFVLYCYFKVKEHVRPCAKVADMQAQWVARVFAGELAMPAVPEMVTHARSMPATASHGGAVQAESSLPVTCTRLVAKP